MHRRHFTGSFLAALLIASALTACDDPAGPRDVAGTYVGTYVLRSVRGDPLPTIFYEAEQTQVHVLADTLRLHLNGTGTETWLLESTGRYASGPERIERPLRFEFRDGRIEAHYPCAANEHCARAITLSGKVTGAELRADVHPYAVGPLVFQRID